MRRGAPTLLLLASLGWLAAGCRTPAATGSAAASAQRGWIEFGLVAEEGATGEHLRDYRHWSAGGAWAVPSEPIWTLREPLLRCRVASAVRDVDALGYPAVNVTLHPADAPVFVELTRRAIGHRLAVLVDGQVVLAPRVVEPLSGTCQLSGRFSEDDARLLIETLSPPG